MSGVPSGTSSASSRRKPLYLPVRMKRLVAVGAAVVLSSLGLLAQTQQARSVLPVQTSDAATRTIKEYCVGCHSERGKSGGLSLADFDVASSTEHAVAAEKIIHKLRASM